MKKKAKVCTILVLAANPKGTTRLRLDEEVKKIEQALERSKKRDHFRLVQKWAVTDDDLRRALLDLEPEIVHFCGHGAGDAGLIFEAENGTEQPTSGESLAELFRLCADHVKCVLLNACFSQVQGQAISAHIGCVIGMAQPIGDGAAIKFALGFYDALGAGRDFQQAYYFGCNAIDLKSIPEQLTPVLMDGTKPRHFLETGDAESNHAEYASIHFEINNDSKHVLVKPAAFQSIGAVLDEVFIHYLAHHVSPYSYGSEWVLLSDFQIAAPLEWVGSHAAIHGISPSWGQTAPGRVGLTPGSEWTIRMPLTGLDAIGVATKNADLADALPHFPKLPAFLARHGYLVSSEKVQSPVSSFEHQVVLRDWLKVGLVSGPILVDTGKPITPEVKQQIGWF